MSALAAAYGLELEGRQLALLCQKLENEVVGEWVNDTRTRSVGDEAVEYRGEITVLSSLAPEAGGLVGARSSRTSRWRMRRRANVQRGPQAGPTAEAC